jgi:hypothetical protein
MAVTMAYLVRHGNGLDHTISNAGEELVARLVLPLPQRHIVMDCVALAHRRKARPLPDPLWMASQLALEQSHARDWGMFAGDTCTRLDAASR